VFPALLETATAEPWRSTLATSLSVPNDRFFGKWTDLDQFQRTRGVLQTFAMALRDAEKWDDSPLIGPQGLLEAPGKDGLSEALLKLAEAAKDSDRETPPVAQQSQDRVASGRRIAKDRRHYTHGA